MAIEVQWLFCESEYIYPHCSHNQVVGLHPRNNGISYNVAIELAQISDNVFESRFDSNFWAMLDLSESMTCRSLIKKNNLVEFKSGRNLLNKDGTPWH
jgi:hypothetical protein